MKNKLLLNIKGTPRSALKSMISLPSCNVCFRIRSSSCSSRANACNKRNIMYSIVNTLSPKCSANCSVTDGRTDRPTDDSMMPTVRSVKNCVRLFFVGSNRQEDVYVSWSLRSHADRRRSVTTMWVAVRPSVTPRQPSLSISSCQQEAALAGRLLCLRVHWHSGAQSDLSS